jgi:hypothetical protein
MLRLLESQKSKSGDFLMPKRARISSIRGGSTMKSAMVFLVAVLLLAAVAFGQGKQMFNMWGGQTEGVPGEEVNLDVFTSDLTGLGVVATQFDFTLPYGWQLISLAPNNERGQFGYFYNEYEPRSFRVGGAGNELKGAGVLLTLRIQISPNVMLGERYALSFFNVSLNATAVENFYGHVLVDRVFYINLHFDQPGWHSIAPPVRPVWDGPEYQIPSNYKALYYNGPMIGGIAERMKPGEAYMIYAPFAGDILLKGTPVDF